MCQITTATKTHIPALARLDTQIFPEDAYTELTFRQLIDLAGPMAVVAASGEMIVGYGIIARSWQQESGWFVALGVDPSLRRRGIGAALVNEAIKMADAQQLYTLRLTVDPTNNVAVRLYERFDFTVAPEESEPDYYGTDRQGRERGRIVMRRNT